MHSDTHRLTRASLELSSSDARKRRTAMSTTALVMLLLAGGGALYLHEPGTSPFAAAAATAALETENAGLRTQLERLNMEFEMEKATRAELDRQAGELHAQINDLTNRLEFLAARDTRANQTR
jgi:septal ring factor EnvC (AmiA/AmiB activator)